jgi:hypothetical protein
VSTEVTRTELLWGLTEFTRRRLEAFRKRRGSKPGSRSRAKLRVWALGVLLSQHVGLLGLPVRFWLLVLLGAVGTVAASAVAILLETSPLRPYVRHLLPLTVIQVVAAPPPAAPRPSATAALPAPVSKSVAELAAEGDRAAAEQLAKRSASERTAEEAVAIDRAKVAQHLSTLDQLARQFQAQPNLATDAEWLRTLRAFVTFDRTSGDALLVAARLPGTAGPDFLYDIWNRAGTRPSTAKVARDVLYASDVRPHASPALTPTLDLYELVEIRQPDACDRLLPVLERVIAEADDRSIKPLSLLRARQGCGAKQTEDCYSCLRRGDPITRATRAVRTRPGPKL